VHTAGVVFNEGNRVETRDLQGLSRHHGAEQQGWLGDLLIDVHALCRYARSVCACAKRDNESKLRVGIVSAQFFEPPAKIRRKPVGHYASSVQLELVFGPRINSTTMHPRTLTRQLLIPRWSLLSKKAR
jgi:hypothetical protein